jgi:hypothetical protein
MERRSSSRIVTTFNAEFSLEEYNYTGVIENISEDGICMRFLSSSTPIEFTPGTELELNIKSSPEETMNLRCVIKWSKSISPDRLSGSAGMEIINPPPEYEELLKKQEYIDLYSDDN